jgi:hypothetical protein
MEQSLKNNSSFLGRQAPLPKSVLPLGMEKAPLLPAPFQLAKLAFG